MRLAIIDGTNAIIRRVSVQKDLPLAQVVRGTVLNIRDFLVHIEATHVVVAFDADTSWRWQRLQQYKSDRSFNTRPAAMMLYGALAMTHTPAVMVDGFEADDVMATYAARVAQRAEVVTLSSDHDLLNLLDIPNVRCFQYAKGGGFEEWTEEHVITRFGVQPYHLPEWYALVGGKNGVDGLESYGPKKVTKLLDEHPEDWREQLAVDERQLWAVNEWVELLTLRKDVQVPALVPADCTVERLTGEGWWRKDQ